MTKNSALKTGLAALTLGVAVAACGSSAAGGIATVPSGGATSEAVTTTAATAATTTPSSGPLATEPTPSKGASPAPTKLVVKVLHAGSGTAAADGDDLTVNFLGWNYATGTPFSGGSSWSSSTKATPYGPIQLGAGEVIPGWDKGLVGIKQGTRVELIIPPSLAYGSDKTSPLTKDTLVFVIDVLKVAKGSASSAASPSPSAG